MKTCRWFIGLACLWAVAAGPTTVPSTQPASRPVEVAAPPPPRPPYDFDLTDSATQAEEAAKQLRQIRETVDADKTADAVRDELAPVSATVADRRSETVELLKSNPQLQVLDETQRDWQPVAAQLSGWKNELKRQLHQYDQASDVLKRLDGTWKREQDLAGWLYRWRDQSRPVVEATQPARDRILQDVFLLQIDIDDRRHQLYAVEGDVDEQNAIAGSMLDEVRRARATAFDRLDTRDGPPIWQLLGQKRESIGNQGQSTFRRQARVAVLYSRTHLSNVGGQLAVFLLLAGGLWWLRSRVRLWATDDPSFEPALPVFSAPISTALVLSVMTGVLFYPSAPRLFWAALIAVALVPTVLLLKPLLDRRLTVLLYALVVSYFLDQVRSVTAAIPIVSRSVFLFEAVALSGLLISLLWQARRDEDRTWKGNLVRVVGYLWAVLLLAVAVGLVVGYIGLANLIGDALLGGAYLSLILYAGTIIAGGVLTLAFRSRPLVTLSMVRRHGTALLHRVTVGIGMIAAALWALAVTEMLYVRPIVATELARAWAVQVSIGSFTFQPAHLLVFGLTIYLAVLISRFVQFVLNEDVYSRAQIEGGSSYAFNRLLHYVIMVVGFYLALAALGIDTSKLTILASAFTIGIGFGMQNIVNNFVSGLILLFERPIKVGDVIQLDDTAGVVAQIGMRASIIRTAESSEVIVPNGNLISTRVTNWTLSNRQRGIVMPLAVDAKSDPCKVIDVLTSTAVATPFVSKSPKPQAVLTTIAGDSFKYELRAWTDHAEQWTQIRSELAMRIHAELNKAEMPLK